MLFRMNPVHTKGQRRFAEKAKFPYSYFPGPILSQSLKASQNIIFFLILRYELFLSYEKLNWCVSLILLFLIRVIFDQQSILMKQIKYKPIHLLLINHQ